MYVIVNINHIEIYTLSFALRISSNIAIALCSFVLDDFKPAILIVLFMYRSGDHFVIKEGI